MVARKKLTAFAVLLSLSLLLAFGVAATGQVYAEESTAVSDTQSEQAAKDSSRDRARKAVHNRVAY